MDHNIYDAHVTRVINGDTIEAYVSLGFRVGLSIVVQLRGLNLPELDQPGGEAAMAATKAAIGDGFLQLRNPVRDGFGRWVCNVTVDGSSLAELVRLQLPEVQA